MAKTAAAPEKGKAYKYPLVNGHKIHLRKVQMTVWGVILSTLLFAAAVAGVYYLGFQQDYHNLFTFLPAGTSAKGWWDGGMGIIHSGNWPLYRHGWRNQIEPAAGTIGVLTFLFGVKANSKNKKVHGLPTLLGLGVALLVVASALAFAETWAIYFGIPDHFNHGHPLPKYPEIAVSIVLGIVLGKILHYIWLPAAATIQYHMVEGPISRGQTPLWVRFAMAPPTLRERFADLQDKVNKKQVTLSQKDNPSGLFRVTLSLGLLVFLLLAVVGNIAKYVIARGTHVPILYP